MVQIHAWERGMTDVRATIDVDCSVRLGRRARYAPSTQH
jgi:hypothetical protein